MVTRLKNSGVFKNSDANLEQICKVYCDYMEQLQMDTCWIKAHFFAQISVESGNGLTPITENLNFSIDGIKATFPTRIFANGKNGAYKDGVK